MLGRSHQEKKDGRFWTDPVLKEAYLRLQTGSGKPRLEFVSDLLGNFFSSRECKHHKKKKIFQLSNSWMLMNVHLKCSQQQICWICYYFGESAHAVYFGPARGQGQAAAQIHEQQKTQFRNTAVSQDQLKNVPKYFQRDETMYLAATFNKTKIFMILPLSLIWPAMSQMSVLLQKSYVEILTSKRWY